MTTRITITSDEWTIAEMRADWADGGKLTETEAAGCADAEYAWLINNTGTRLPSWTFSNGAFTGPITANAPQLILCLISDATDYVLSVMDEITAEAAAEQAEPAKVESLDTQAGLPFGFDPARDGCVYHRDAFSDVKRNLCGTAKTWWSVEGDLWCDTAMRLFRTEMGANDPAVVKAVQVI